MKYRFLDGARLELLDAGRHYVMLDRRLMVDLEAETERALGYLCEFPQAAKLIDKVHRSYKLRRFPYLLIYRIQEDEIVAVAIAHAARERGYWRARPDNGTS